MNKILYAVLTLLIAAGILIGVFFQVMVLPGAARAEVELYPPYAPFLVPLLTLAIAFLACMQVALVAVWALLTRAVSGRYFRPASLRWVSVVISAVALAVLLIITLLIYVWIADLPTPDEMGMSWLLIPLGGILGILVGAGLLALGFVGHGLMRRAIADRRELDGVI